MEQPYLDKIINTTAPSDLIQLTAEADEKISSFWVTNEIKDGDLIRVPSDIFFANTVPLMDCEIIVDERGIIAEGRKVSYRIVICEEYLGLIKEASSEYGVMVGALICSPTNKYTAVFPIVVVEGVPFCGCVVSVAVRNDRTMKWSNVVLDADLEKGAASMIRTWYGIQISLLHPELRELFSNPRQDLVYDKRETGGKRKRITRYIKRHTINADDIDKALNRKDAHGINRKALAWYVIGHWRNYKNGKTIFIQGYWKGELRHMKKNLDEGRERIIAI